MRTLFIILAIIYMLAPDFCPGPIDDVIVLILAMSIAEGFDDDYDMF